MIAPAGDQQVPTHALGVPSGEHLVPAADTAPVDLPAIIAEHPTANPFLDARRAALGLPARTGTHAASAFAAASDQVGPAGAGFAAPTGDDPGPVRHGDRNGIGNFELCVASRGQVQHWWRDNSGSMFWQQSATFGHDVAAVAGLVESSFGFNLETVVLGTDRQLQPYWRDGAGWHEGAVIGRA